VFGEDDGDLFLVTVASMFGPSFHLCWPLMLLSSGKELRTTGLWGKKLPIGSESMESPPPLAINFNGMRERKRWRLGSEREKRRERERYKS